MDVASLPDPSLYPGRAFSVRQDIFLQYAGGIPSETVHAGDIIASDGRMWYHVTRSDSPGSNSFYANPMELEIFRLAINEGMLAVNTTFTLTFELTLQLFKATCAIQYLIVVELGNLVSTTVPAITGPNLFQVDWIKTPFLQQRIIITDSAIVHKMGAQVIRTKNDVLKTNKKIYGYVAAGDIIPGTPAFAIRCRLIEFDTEDNSREESGLIYYALKDVKADIK